MKKRTKQANKTKNETIVQAEEPIVDDGYDGYYDDVLPPDMDREKEGLDKELIKKVALVGIGVFCDHFYVCCTFICSLSLQNAVLVGVIE